MKTETIINFFDLKANDSTMVQFDRKLTQSEIKEIESCFKDYIKNLLQDGKFFDFDDKKCLEKVLNEKAVKMNFSWKILHVSEYNIIF